MTIKQQAYIDWYQHQYDATKKSLLEECANERFWNNRTAEENLISKLVYMTQLRNMIEGLKTASEEE